MLLVEFECEQCGCSFSRAAYIVKRRNHHFCSDACSRAWRNQKVQVSCEYCGAKLIRSPSRAERSQHQFCSFACQRAWRREQVPTETKVLYVDVPCHYCGKPIHMRERQAAKTKHHYCDSECHWKAQQQFYSTYNYRNLESTPKQKLVRFLVSHDIGTQGTPGEDIILHVKSGFLFLGYPYMINPSRY